MSKQDISMHITSWMDQLPALPGADVPRLLLAISGVESSYGKNNIPRHEDSYCRNQNGRNVNAIVILRHRRWGCEACCSWGPWQQLYHQSADLGFAGAPHELTDPQSSLPFVIKRLRQIIQRGVVT